MTRTLLDLFKQSHHSQDIHPSTQSVLKTELNGLRIKSKVELNNPLLFGSAVGRITLRSTPVLEDMQDAAGKLSKSGAISNVLGKLTGGNISSLSGIRNNINSKLGIPELLIPTRVLKLKGTHKSVQDVLDKKNGTDFGSILKNAAGSPKTIVKNTIGGLIKIGKGKLRDKLFGTTSKSTSDSDFDVYNTYNTYTNVAKYMGVKDDIESKLDFKALTHVRHHKSNNNIDIAKYSPIYGVDRKSTMWTSELGQKIRKSKFKDAASGNTLTPYSSTKKYTESKIISDNTLEGKRGISNGYDTLNTNPKSDNPTDTEKSEGLDLIPFWIGEVGSKVKTHFRTIVTTINETVTPSWSENSFFGNPYKFYTYTGVDRTVSFSLKLYCSNPVELNTMWERVTQLTKFNYPTITADGLINPPIISFRLGDIYNNKIGYLDGLTYTVDENTTWETDPDIGLLPKFIEVSLTIKFIEQPGTEDDLYGYKKSKEEVAAINEKRKTATFSTKSQNGASHTVKKLPKMTIKGIAKTAKELQPLKSLQGITGNKITPPVDLISSLNQNITGNSAIKDKIKAKSSISAAVSLLSNQNNLTEAQSYIITTTLLPYGYKPTTNNIGLTLDPGTVLYANKTEYRAVTVDGNIWATPK